MIVYADRDEVVDSRRWRRQAENAADPVERIIALGQWEAGVLDALCPELDDDVDAYSVEAPDRIRLRVPEGFAFYAVYPEQYRAAAARFYREHTPGSCVVIGIRSIGTTLSRVVAEALPCPVWRFTVRPRGHPFDRRIDLSDRLRARLAQYRESWVLVVDEGPGLSGSSFTSVAEALNALGIPDQRIVFFPSHEPDPAAFVSQRARDRWPCHRKYFEPFQPGRYLPAGARDLSGGQWRDLLGIDVPVNPQHERRKYLYDGRLYKFSGLGAYGRRKLERGRELAEAGFTPRVLGLQNGFLESDFVEGRLSACGGVARRLLQTILRYLSHMTITYKTNTPVRYEGLVHMIHTNTGLVLPDRNPEIEDGEVVAVDGRMLPHEWLETSDGRWLKADALDHHDDHFFPGCQDIAWDYAATSVEFDVPFDALPLSHSKLTFYATAYLAYRIGYCNMCGFSEQQRRYTAILERVAERPIVSSA
jgi:hypothetical protein